MSIRDDDEDDFLSNKYTAELEDTLGYYYIEDSLNALCEDEGHHSLLQGGHYFQPGFTLLATVLILVLFLMCRRFESFVALCWPTKLEKRADALVVAASTMSVSDQFALIYQLSKTIPSTKGIFPDGNFISAAKCIADHDMERSRPSSQSCSCPGAEIKLKGDDDKVEFDVEDGSIDRDPSRDPDPTSPPTTESKEENTHTPCEEESLHQHLSRWIVGVQPSEVVLSQNQAQNDPSENTEVHIRTILMNKLGSEDAVDLILGRFSLIEHSTLVEALQRDEAQYPGVFFLPLSTSTSTIERVEDKNQTSSAAQNEVVECELPTADTNAQDTGSKSDDDKHSLWEGWRDSAGEKELESWIEEIESWIEKRNQSTDRDIALIFLFFEVAVGMWVLGEFYLAEPFPKGHWFYCQLPYVISVVSYKPFAMPMWACITVICPYTFAEYTFGRHPKGRDASGTCNTSSIPRNAYSVALVFIVTALLLFWWAMALFGYLIPLLVFSPVLLLPAFVIPFIALYAPTRSLDCAVSRAGKTSRQEKRDRNIKVGDRVEFCSGTEPWRKGVVTALDGQGKPWILPDISPLTEERVATDSWDYLRPESTHECTLLHSTFEETIFALRLAATQLIIAVMIALPVMQLYRGDYSWGDGAKDILGVTFNFPSLVMQLKVSFFWPSFYSPRLQFQFAIGASIVFAQMLIRLGQVVIRVSKLNSWIMLRFVPYGTSVEALIVRIFASVSWLPFRASMDRMRSAIDGAVVESKRRQPKVAPGEGVDLTSDAKPGVLSSLHKFVVRFLYCIGMLTCWQPLQSTQKDVNVKAFSGNTRDDDIDNFTNGEEAIWYSGISIHDNPHLGQIIPHVYQCIWFTSLKITNCRNVEGSLEDLAVWLIDLIHLEVGRTPNSKVPKLIEPLDAAGNALQQLNRIPWFQGDLVSLGTTKRLTVVNLSWTVVDGDISIFQYLKNIRVINLVGCAGVKGSVSVFEHTPYLQSCLLGSTGVTGAYIALTSSSNGSLLNLENSSRRFEVISANTSAISPRSGVYSCRRYTITALLLSVAQLAQYAFNDSGSLCVFRNTPLLIAVNLQHGRCEGSIQIFENTRNLESADLDGARGIYGSISVFASTPQLESLGLSETCCEGNISVFERTPKLKVLRLAQTAAAYAPSTSSTTTRRFATKVNGSIAVFEKTPNLRALNLHATSCIGDIASFEATPKIHSINLNGSSVGGDVSVFQSCSRLLALNLWRTRVIGNISVFAAASQLRSLVLARTEVYGDAEGLRRAIPKCDVLI